MHQNNNLSLEKIEQTILEAERLLTQNDERIVKYCDNPDLLNTDAPELKEHLIQKIELYQQIRDARAEIIGDCENATRLITDAEESIFLVETEEPQHTHAWVKLRQIAHDNPVKTVIATTTLGFVVGAISVDILFEVYNTFVGMGTPWDPYVGVAAAVSLVANTGLGFFAGLKVAQSPNNTPDKERLNVNSQSVNYLAR